MPCNNVLHNIEVTKIERTALEKWNFQKFDSRCCRWLVQIIWWLMQFYLVTKLINLMSLLDTISYSAAFRNYIIMMPLKIYETGAATNCRSLIISVSLFKFYAIIIKLILTPMWNSKKFKNVKGTKLWINSITYIQA